MGKSRWEIIHEDDAIIVVNKPAGLLTIPDRYDEKIPNLHGQLLAYRDEVLVNHRLDRDTSGIILFSKSLAAHAAFSEMFEKRTIDKLYYAIVHGAPIEEVGLIDLSIGASKNKRKQMVIDHKGKASSTKYRIISTWMNHSLLQVKILTGRTHQIRLHMQAINCPILCDSLYGDGEPFLLSTIKRKYRSGLEKEERPLLSRMALHAHQLNFVHPFTGKEMSLTADIPKDMKAVIFQMDKLKK